MLRLVVDVPEPLSQQVKASGLSQQQLSKVMTYFLEIYLRLEQTKAFIEVISGDEQEIVTQKPSRKAGSARHLGITISEDFDEPLADFAEYM